MIVYDHQFNANEWFILIGLFIGIVIILVLPKRFTRVQSAVFFMCGVYSGFFFDHTLSVQPVSFYDVNDASKFQMMDFISYWMYGPVSYLFFYIADACRITPSRGPLLILGWSLFGVATEGAAVWAGVFHYRYGYKLYYSLPIYLIVQSCWMAIYFRYRGLRVKPTR